MQLRHGDVISLVGMPENGECCFFVSARFGSLAFLAHSSCVLFLCVLRRLIRVSIVTSSRFLNRSLDVVLQQKPPSRLCIERFHIAQRRRHLWLSSHLARYQGNLTSEKILHLVSEIPLECVDSFVCGYVVCLFKMSILVVMRRISQELCPLQW